MLCRGSWHSWTHLLRHLLINVLVKQETFKAGHERIFSLLHCHNMLGCLPVDPDGFSVVSGEGNLGLPGGLISKPTNHHVEFTFGQEFDELFFASRVPFHVSIDRLSIVVYKLSFDPTGILF